MSTKNIGQKFVSAAQAARFLNGLHSKMLHWRVAVDDDVCVPCFRLNYPVMLKLPKGIRFRGLHTCEIKLNPNTASPVVREFPQFAKALLTDADEAALLFEGHNLDTNKSFFFAYRRAPRRVSVDLLVGIDQNNLDETKTVFAELFIALKADVKMRKVGERIEYYPAPDVEVVKMSTNEKGQSNRISVSRKESRPGELFECLLEIINRLGNNVQEMALFLSYPFRKEETPRQASKVLDTLNAMKLPIKRIKCEVHCSIDSLQSIGAMSRLRKMDCDNSTIEQTVAKFITPGGLPGFVVVGAVKSGFTTKLYAGQVSDEEAFAKELETLLKKNSF